MRNGIAIVYCKYRILYKKSSAKNSFSSETKRDKMFDDKGKVFRDECARSMSVLDGYYEPLLKRNRGHFVSGLVFCISICSFQLLAAVRRISLVLFLFFAIHRQHQTSTTSNFDNIKRQQHQTSTTTNICRYSILTSMMIM